MTSKRLIVGDTAPIFKSNIWDGGTLALDSYRGKKIWLAFFRYAACPLCNLRVNAMIQQYPLLQQGGIDIITIFQSPTESIAKYVAQQKPPFPLVSDPEEQIYALYNVESDLAGFLNPGNLPELKKAMQTGFMPGKPDGTLTRIPADFLIDENGIIQHAFYGGKIADHIPFETVYNFIK